ncbi:MAG: smalltalk protein [Prevotella sp.]|nr:smalltalk protein [Prevotella sp.]
MKKLDKQKWQTILKAVAAIVAAVLGALGAEAFTL